MIGGSGKSRKVPSGRHTGAFRGKDCMVVIRFPDRDALKKGLGFLLGRSSGHVLRSGEMIVPESAVEALLENNFAFTVLGKATYEQQVAAIRGDSAFPPR
jgi:hypothetical protein